MCGPEQVAAACAGGFSEGQIILSIGWASLPSGLRSDWETIVRQYSVQNQYRSKVLGYLIDEPSGKVSASTMAYVKQRVTSYGLPLFLDDYDTGVLPWPYYDESDIRHPTDQGTLNLADFVWNDGNTSRWISGANFFGIDRLPEDYDEFQSWFGSKFNGIACKPMDGSGALMNDPTMWNWLISYTNCNHFALYLDPSLANDWAAALRNFMVDADYAGLFGHRCNIFHFNYTCKVNNVNFTPPQGNDRGAGAASFSGVWTNNSYYRGPVDPTSPGAVECCVETSYSNTGQTIDTY